MPLTPQRAALYDRLTSLVGNTPLGEIKSIPIPGNNRILFKEEYKNPTGSHYDRTMVRLLRAREDEGYIEPGRTPLVDTSTGNSGASFAWLCRILGYQCEVFIPADMPPSRIAQIKSFGATVHYSPKGQYVDGLVKAFRKFLKEQKGKYATPNHSADEVYCIQAMGDLAREVIRDANTLGARKIDYFISALGNGTNTRGIGSVLMQEHKTAIIGVEPVESPTVFQIRFPEKFKQMFSGISQTGQHGLIGTGPGVTDFRFPNMHAIIPSLQEIITVDRKDWEMRLRQLQDIEGYFVGHTSAACLHAALQMAEQVSNKNFLIIFYDPYWKYL